MIKALDSVIVYVADLQRAIEWYQTVLELPEPNQFGDFVVFNLENARLALHGAQLEPEERKNRGVMPVLRVSSYDEAKATLESRDCKFFYENRLAHANFGTFHDLEGNPIQIIERL